VYPIALGEKTEGGRGEGEGQVGEKRGEKRVY
jgi:hypothetical protein